MNVLIVFAHPDDESYGPGATIAGLAAGGARLTLITMTRGEQSTLGAAEHGTPERLAAVREQELQQAVRELGIADLRQYRYPDGGLQTTDRVELEALVGAALRELEPELVLTFGTGGISGHPDHVAASQVAVAAVRRWASEMPAAPVYGWAMPSHIRRALAERLGREYAASPDERILEVPVRAEWLAAQWRAVQHHRSQHQPPPWPFEVRLEVQAGHEYLERLLPESPPPAERLFELLRLPG